MTKYTIKSNLRVEKFIGLRFPGVQSKIGKSWWEKHKIADNSSTVRKQTEEKVQLGYKSSGLPLPTSSNKVLYPQNSTTFWNGAASWWPSVQMHEQIEYFTFTPQHTP